MRRGELTLFALDRHPCIIRDFLTRACKCIKNRSFTAIGIAHQRDQSTRWKQMNRVLAHVATPAVSGWFVFETTGATNTHAASSGCKAKVD